MAFIATRLSSALQWLRQSHFLESRLRMQTEQVFGANEWKEAHRKVVITQGVSSFMLGICFVSSSVHCYEESVRLQFMGILSCHGCCNC